MKKTAIFQILIIVILFITWGVFLFGQHLACFDIFDTNLWYLYLLALLFAIIHYTAVIFISKKSSSHIPLIIIGSIYASLSFAKLSQILASVNYDAYPQGLTIFCLILDALGSLISFIGLYKQKNRAD